MSDELKLWGRLISAIFEALITTLRETTFITISLLFSVAISNEGENLLLYIFSGTTFMLERTSLGCLPDLQMHENLEVGKMVGYAKEKRGKSVV